MTFGGIISEPERDTTGISIAPTEKVSYSPRILLFKIYELLVNIFFPHIKKLTMVHDFLDTLV